MSKKKHRNKNEIIQIPSTPGLLKTVRIFIYLTLFTPLIVHTGFIFPFVFPKILYFQVLIEIAFVLWVLLILKEKQFRPRLNLLTKTILLFFVVLVIASVFGVAPYKSFFSNYERSDGLFTLFHFLAFFFILSSCFKTKKDWLILFNISIFVAIIVSFYALSQKLGWVETYQGGVRLDATTGNPAYLAAYLIFNIFLSLYLWLKAPKRWLKFLYLAIFLFQLLIVYFTATRGAILALGFGAVLFLFLFLFFGRHQKSKLKTIGWILLLLLIIFSGLVWLNKDKSWVKDSQTLKRLVTISLKDPTTKTRLLAWRMSWQGFKQKPILGWGWENYNILFNKHYDPQMYPTENWFDKPHNIVFDVGTSGGIMALLSYLAVFCACVYGLWRKGERDFWTIIVFSVFLVVYFLQNLFVFDTPSAYLMLFVILGFIVARWPSAERKESNIWRALDTTFFRILIISLVFFVFWYFSFRPASASKSAIRGAIYLQEGKVPQAIEALGNSYRRATLGQDEIIRITSDAALPLINRQDVPKELRESLREIIIQAGEKALKTNSKDVRYRITLANLITSLYFEDQPQKIAQAWEIIKEAISWAPAHPLLHFQVAQIKIFTGDFQGAVEVLEKTVAQNEQAIQPHVYLALAYILDDQEEKAQAQIEKIKEINGGMLDLEDQKRVVRIWWQRKNKEKALEILEEMESSIEQDETQRQEIGNWLFLTNFYIELKEKERAEAAGQRVIELDGEYEESIKNSLRGLQAPEEK